MLQCCKDRDSPLENNVVKTYSSDTFFKTFFISFKY